MSKKHRVITAISCCFAAAIVVVFGGFVWAADEPRVATIEYGDISIELGMDEDQVIAALELGFKIQMQEPDPQFHDLVGYSIHDRRYLPEVKPLRSYVGKIYFEGGKLRTASRRVMGGKRTLDSEELMTRLTDLLGATSEKLGIANPSTRWRDGVFQGRKDGNRTLIFDFGLELVAVTYFDSPGGSKHVTLSVSIG